MTKKNTTINVENKEQYKKRSMWAEVWRNYKKNPSAMIGLVTELGANDMIFGIISAIPQVAALL